MYRYLCKKIGYFSYMLHNVTVWTAFVQKFKASKTLYRLRPESSQLAENPVKRAEMVATLNKMRGI